MILLTIYACVYKASHSVWDPTLQLSTIEKVTQLVPQLAMDGWLLKSAVVASDCTTSNVAKTLKVPITHQILEKYNNYRVKIPNVYWSMVCPYKVVLPRYQLLYTTELYNVHNHVYSIYINIYIYCIYILLLFYYYYYYYYYCYYCYFYYYIHIYIYIFTSVNVKCQYFIWLSIVSAS